MSHIIAAHFQLQDQIERARAALTDAGFAGDQISAFYVNQPGQHDLAPYGGDREQSPGAKDTPAGVIDGITAGGVIGAVVGVTTAAVTGPIGPLLGALVGAHVGSLYSFTKMKEVGEHEAGGEQVAPPRPAGMLIAVAVRHQAECARAVEVLEGLGAGQLEVADGTIVGGDWADFDPLGSPVPLH